MTDADKFKDIVRATRSVSYGDATNALKKIREILDGPALDPNADLGREKTGTEDREEKGETHNTRMSGARGE